MIFGISEVYVMIRQSVNILLLLASNGHKRKVRLWVGTFFLYPLAFLGTYLIFSFNYILIAGNVRKVNVITY